MSILSYSMFMVCVLLMRALVVGQGEESDFPMLAVCLVYAIVRGLEVW